MTEGSISQKIIFFAIPLFLGNLFQQLYNTADSLIVGNFLGSNALAAVSSSGNLIFLMVGFINGIAMGAGVVIARYYGAKKRDCMKGNPYNGCIWTCGRCCADSFGNVSGTKDPGIDGNSCGRAPGIYCVFPYIFCRVYGCCHVQYLCWSSAVGR